MRRLFEGGVYSRAAFIRGNTVMILCKDEIIKHVSFRQHHACTSVFTLLALTVHVGSCQLNSRLIKSKFVSEFVGTDKPTKFVSCTFVGSCQLNSRLIDRGTQRENSSKTLKHSIVKRILVFKR